MTTIRQGYKKDYDKRTGSIKCDRPTTMGHIIAHIENGKKFFNIRSSYWGSPCGFEYDERFPPFVNRIVREIDIKYGPGQDRSYYFINPFEPDWATEDDWSGEWPVWDRNYDDLNVVIGTLADEEKQIWSWISNFNYMLHDAMVSHIYAIATELTERMIDSNGNDLEGMAVDIANWKSEFRKQQAEHIHKPKEVEHDKHYNPICIEWRGKIWEIVNE